MNEPDESIPCPSCGQTMGPGFCAHCGEKSLDAKSRSIRHILGDYIENITSVDSKIWRTLKLLLTQPGQYEHNYHVGKRVNYLKPIGLFLILNFLFVLFSPITDFNVTLYDQIKLQPYSTWIESLFYDVILPNSATEAAIFNQQYNQTVKIVSRSTIIIQALVFFIFVALINFRKSYFLGDHLVFSLNLHSWYMAWIVILKLIVITIITAAAWFGLDLSYGQWYFTLLPIGLGIYLLLATHNMYAFKWWDTLIRATLLFGAIKVSHIIYRLIQFFLVTSLV